jgi:hypothetical protein
VSIDDQCDDDGELPDELRAVFRAALLDDAHVAARRAYVAATVDRLNDLSGWLALDSWLGGSKVPMTPDLTDHQNEMWDEFRAVASVVCMSAELARTAAACLERGQVYASAALVRQLLECEYLLSLFAIDLEHARRWRTSTPDELRKQFQPKHMRKIGGFNNEEYWNHCDLGGHPNPKAWRMIEWLSIASKIFPVSREELAVDLGLHLDRTWRATDHLLQRHHARYEQVRSTARIEAERAFGDWRAVDPVVALFVGMAVHDGDPDS